MTPTLLTSASHLLLLSRLARSPSPLRLLSLLPASSPLRAFCPRARAAICSAYSSSDAMADADSNNPLLADFDFPPFDRVEPAHVRPGIRAILARLEGELEELESGVEPAWEKLVHPLERIVDRLDVVWNVVDHLKAVKDSADLRAAVEDVQPEKVKFYLRLGQSKPIYEAFNAIRNSSDWDSLSDARKRVVQGQIKDAVLGGVALEDEQREKFNQIQQELEKLSEKFSENVLDATKKFEKLITDKKEIDGLPASALGLAAQTAVSKGHENASAENGPWMITLDAPSFMAVMQHAKNRALREEVYRAYLTRASSGDLDNTDIISQILKLRLEKAKLLGYKNFAEVSMARKMATVDRVQELLEKIRAASWDHAVQDMEDLKAFVKDSGSAEANDLAHWDLNFWSERLRESTYDIDEEGLRPYFALPKVMDGLFSLANKLFGITVEAADGLAPVWNSDVKFYCVKDSSNSPVAYFYFDPYSRPSEKRGGAWMNVVFSRSSVLARHGSSVRLPVAHMVCNQMPPVGDKPSLMTFREVETVFHEFGHALQHMLTRQDEAFVAGISGIEWDAVELPSQFRENLCYHKNTLLSIAKHYETGEPLPEEIYAKLVAAKNFRAGTFSLRQIRFASVDMELHTTYDPSGAVSVYDVDRRIAEKTQVLAPLPEDRFLCGFSHIFAGGCAAGYYSYKVVRQFKRPLDVSEKEIDAAGDGDVLVILDLRADQSLIEAGVAREVVNRIRRNPLRSCRQASALSSSTSERESFCPAGVQAKPTVPRARATGHQYLQSGTGASAKPSPKMGDSSVEVTEESQPNARVGTEFTGVRRQASGRYTAQAKDERGKDKHLGTFDTAAEAVEVREDFVLNLELKEQLKKKKKKKKEKACIALEKRVVSAQENSSAAEESIAESPEEEKRPLQEGDRVKYVGQSRTLSNGQHGRIHKINGDQVAVLFDPTLCLLDTSDILHDNDNEAEDSYIAMQAFFEEKYMHRVQELEKKHMHEVQELEKKHMHEVQELEKKCTHEVQELNKELLLQNDAAATKEECFRAERLEMFLEAKNLRNTIINLTGQIRIFCRVRPLKKDETKCILDFDGAPKGDIGIMCGTKRVFKFDRVYTPNDDQAKVYSDVSPLVTSVMDGCNVCIFAYGQTGTGKTFTMEGTERDRGVNYRTLEELFKIAEEREDITYNISVVVLEIYNEEIRDLLATSSSSKKLEVRETCEGTHYVPGVAEVTVKDLNEVWGVLQSSNNSRAVASNNVNEHSSRSHCALCVVVRATNLINGDFSKSKLWLVDLAGTERLTNTNAEGDRRNEAININNSLTCLGNVISSLVKREKHIPYRESNLTKLLQDSIGGDAKTLMILQLSPSENDASQTLTTLNYAQRARSWPAKKDVMMSKAKTARPPLQDVMMSKAKTARPPLQDVMMSKAKTVRPPPAGSRAKLQQQTSTPPAGSRVKLQQQTSTPPAGSRVKLQQQTPKTVRNFRM